MTTCPSCATECPAGSRFCNACGALLAVPAYARSERRVITCLFCDLVDFTALCERADPEDVDRLLRDYYALARRVIETYGGIVEKFVGDAVVGVFGLPAVHEDDPERAVRAGLRLVERIGELPPAAGTGSRVRVGINTGPALVRLDVDPGSGAGFQVGDAVNTAARLETIAPPMGVVVGDATHALTSDAVVYEALDPVPAKGKSEPLRPWLARGTVARTGVDLRRSFASPLIDREVELGMLTGLLQKVRASSMSQFVLLVGEAGIGKSRLVHELARFVDAQPDLLVTWREGHCPPYGDGLTFWALGEIVKGHLGLRDSDDAQTIEAALARVYAADPDGAWMVARLRALLGLEAPQASRDENFTAWTRFLAGLAATYPVVLIFEDLHWASEGTLDFLDHLMRNSADVPMLVIALARPELLDSRRRFVVAFDEFAVDTGRARRLEVKSLSPSESERLVGKLTEPAAPGAVTAAIVERCGGNPLYTEELVRLLGDQASLAAETGGQLRADLAADALPGSLQALIAARLDALPPAQRERLADAAVVGQVFWTGAVAALDHGDHAAAERDLGELAQREMIRPHRDSSIAGETEYAFRHALTREVAYAVLPRVTKAAKHAAVAEWIESSAGARPEDLAEVLAHHYATAIEQARLASDDELTAVLLDPTVRALRRAGDRALPLDVAAAERYYGRAIALVPDDHALRSHILVAWADALAQSGDLARAAALLEEGLADLRAAGDRRAAAIALTRLRDVYWELNDPRASGLVEQALALLEEDQPSAEKVRVLAEYAVDCAVNYRGETAIAAADTALGLCAQLGLPDSARALAWRGMARCNLGEAAGLDDLRRAIDLAADQGLFRETSVMFYILADEVGVFEGPRQALDIAARGLEFAFRRGDRVSQAILGELVVEWRAAAGEWDAALAGAEDLEPLFQERGQTEDMLSLRSLRARLLASRGAVAEAEPLAAWCEGQPLVEPGQRTLVLSALAAVQLAAGDREAACDSLEDLDRLRRSLGSRPQFGLALPTAVRVAVAAGDPGLASRLVEDAPLERALDAHTVATLSASVAELRGDHAGAAAAFAAAAQHWQEFGTPHEEALALLGQGRCLVALGQCPQALGPLREARQILATLGARPALDETDALLTRCAGEARD